MSTTEQIDFQPDYVCWHEQDFLADLHVRRMTPHQRLMYRALCQSAFFCSTRPYLPDDDEELTALADADSLEHWKANRNVVLRKFRVIEIDGQRLLAHKRLLADWEQQLEAYESRQEKWTKGKNKRSSAARKAANTRWNNAEPCDSDAIGMREPCDEMRSMRNDALKLNLTETETKANQSQVNQTETKANSDSGSVSGSVAPSCANSVDSGSVGSEKSRVQPLIDAWFNAQPNNGTWLDADEAFVHLWNSGITEGDVLAVLSWLPKSDYWGKSGKGELDGPAGFCKAFHAIRKTYESYKSAIKSRKKPRFVEEDTEVGADQYEVLAGGSKTFVIEEDRYE